VKREENRMAKDDDILTAKSDNRREFTRVNACIPFSFRLVPAMDTCYLKSRTIADSYLTDLSIMPNVEDQMYGEWLKLINAKLDEVIKMLTMQREGFSTLPLRNINISGNGISFFSNEAFEKGAILEVKIVLTILSSMAMLLYGEVVTVEIVENGYNVAFRFIKMDDLIRNEIIRFVFEREREMIREKRGA
jgi:hypothetical protein